MVDLTVTGHSHEPPSALLDDAGFSASHRLVTRNSVHDQALFLHRRDGPPLERIIGGMDEIRLHRCTDVRAEKNPRVCALYQVRAAFEISIHSQKIEFVAAQGDKETIARGLTGRQNSNYFQPTNQSAPLLARAGPPATARCHEPTAIVRSDQRGSLEKVGALLLAEMTRRGIAIEGAESPMVTIDGETPKTKH